MKINAPQLTTCPALEGNWVVTEDFHYEGHGVSLTIPRGFVTDLASIPRFLWRVIAPFELSLTAPILHDILFRSEGQYQGNSLSFKETNLLFLAVMKDEGVGWWRRNTAYQGVKWFGKSSWGAARVQVIALEG